MKLQIENISLPAHWASALINGDYSGCSDVEQKEINDWINDNPHYGPCHGCSEQTELEHFDGLQTDCLKYDFPIVFYTSRNFQFNGVTHQTHSLIYPAQVKTTDAPRNNSRTGYGKKLPTEKMVLLCGIWRRVYCTIYSNAGSCWVNFEGKQINVESVL